VAFVVALAVGLLATPVAITVAHRSGIVDRPGALKPQEKPVAYLGGVAVAVAWAAATLADDGGDVLRLLVPTGLALLLGLADDVADLPPTTRVACELGIGVAAGWAVPAVGGPVGWVVTAVLVVGLLNAVNLLDGLDGLAAGVGTASALGFAALDGGVDGPALALAGALVGFLAYNRPPARVYLGDAGAYLLGTTLALLAAGAVRADGGIATWAALPLVVLVPVGDTAVAIVRRRLAGVPLFEGDRSHVYDQLVDRGWSKLAVAATLVAAQTALAATAVGVARLDAGPAVAVSAAAVVAGALVVLAAGFLRPRGEGGDGDAGGDDGEGGQSDGVLGA
jgi:UDP-GlcNAc:undecaprenyl-phosphate GlcNAc-1-phosphate transferase